MNSEITLNSSLDNEGRGCERMLTASLCSDEARLSYGSPKVSIIRVSGIYSCDSFIIKL